MSSRNGRGRGISNVPAWMSQNNADEDMRGGGGGNGGTGGGGDDRSNRRSSPDRRPSASTAPNDDSNPNDDPNSRYFTDKRRDYDRERGRNNDEYSNRGRRGGGGGGGGGGNQHRSNNNNNGSSNNNNWDQRDDRRRSRPPHRHPSREREPRSTNNRRPNGNRSGIFFGSAAEERDWVDDRTRKRRERRPLFDVEPTEEQLAMEELQKATLAASGAHPASFVRQEEQPRERSGRMVGGTSRGVVSSQPQQTRHARRLYIGHLPPDLDEDEVHQFFKDAIHTALGQNNSSHGDDPILSVYINKERRFAFVEFKTMDICTACLALDGVDVCKKGKVKIKRPNDYNPSLAPPASSTPDGVIQKFDISKLGIISGTVPDSPNKIFIGGLPYHLDESQVMELLGAFGKVKAFHLVKADPTALTSKGYCFVEYSDGESIRDVAVMGLNGMDMGGGKVLSARIAAVRGDPETTRDGRGGSTGMDIPGLGNVAPIIPSSGTVGGVVPPQMRYVDGVDVEALLDVAMGLAPLSSAAVVAAPPPVPGMYYGPVPTAAAAGPPGIPPGAVAAPIVPVLDIANAALEAAFGSNAAAPPPPQDTAQKTRILVLLNMVTDEDLATDEDYGSLMDEVKEECLKYGNLLSMKAPRPQDGFPQSAVKKIFLEYATVQESGSAERELAGRQFGPAVVEVVYFNEEDYANGKLL